MPGEHTASFPYTKDCTRPLLQLELINSLFTTTAGDAEAESSCWTSTVGGALSESGEELGAPAGEDAAEGVLEVRREPPSLCCSISVQIPTISVIILRIASAVLLSPAAAGTASASVKKLPV